MTQPASLVLLDRQQQILNEALTRRVLRVKDLAQVLGVHEMTVRRDLDLLADHGMLERVHGGARLTQRTSEELSQRLRALQQQESKSRMARAAIALIGNGEAVAFDSSTTTLALVDLLPAREAQAIVTSLDAAERLASAGQPFTLLGGTFNTQSRSFVGPLTTSALRRLHPDKVFFSAKSFSPDFGFSDPRLPEAEAKEVMIANASLVVAMVDHTKFGRRSLHTIVALGAVDVLVTDEPPGPEVLAALEANDTRLIVAQEAP